MTACRSDSDDRAYSRTTVKLFDTYFGEEVGRTSMPLEESSADISSTSGWRCAMMARRWRARTVLRTWFFGTLARQIEPSDNPVRFTLYRTAAPHESDSKFVYLPAISRASLSSDQRRWSICQFFRTRRRRGPFSRSFSQTAKRTVAVSPAFARALLTTCMSPSPKTLAGNAFLGRDDSVHWHLDSAPLGSHENSSFAVPVSIDDRSREPKCESSTTCARSRF